MSAGVRKNTRRSGGWGLDGPEWLWSRPLDCHLGFSRAILACPHMKRPWYVLLFGGCRLVPRQAQQAQQARHSTSSGGQGAY